MNFIKTIFATAIGFVLAIAVFCMFMFLLVVSASFNGKSKAPSISKNTVLELNLGMEVPDLTSDQPNPFSGNAQNVSLTQILYGLDKAAKDSKIKGVLLRADFYSGGYANASEIRNKLIEFKKLGKFVYAYGEVFTEQGYYIASVCDSIFLNPTGVAELNGLSSNVVMYKGMLAKLGVEVQVFKVGKFKGAVEAFANDQLSPENKTQIQTFLNDIYNQTCSKIASSRKLNVDTLTNYISNYKAYNAKLAKKLNFVDRLVYEDEVLETCKLKANNTNSDFTLNSFTQYASNDLDLPSKGEKIAVVFAQGEIGVGKGDLETEIAGQSMVEELRKVRNSNDYKALVIRVNSPGGSSNASDIIAREIALIKKKMPVIVSFGNVAASGGYYIACLADYIMAQPTTITGSIGVFALIPNTAKAYKEKLGLGYETISTGDYASMGRPDQPLAENQKVIIQSLVNDIYTDFISIVSKGRKLSVEKVQELAQGRVYTANAALNIGLVDGFGGLQDAIKLAALKANLSNYTMDILPKSKPFFEKFFGNPAIETSITSKLPSTLRTSFNEIKKVEAALQNSGKAMLRMPFDLNIK